MQSVTRTSVPTSEKFFSESEKSTLGAKKVPLFLPLVWITFGSVLDAPGDGSRAGHHGICGMNAGRIHRCGDNYKIDAGLKFEAIRVKTTDFAALRVSMVGSVSGTQARVPVVKTRHLKLLKSKS